MNGGLAERRGSRRAKGIRSGLCDVILYENWEIRVRVWNQQVFGTFLSSI